MRTSTEFHTTAVLAREVKIGDRLEMPRDGRVSRDGTAVIVRQHPRTRLDGRIQLAVLAVAHPFGSTEFMVLEPTEIIVRLSTDH